MNVELTIQEMFDEYPALFKERADCLNHLFCAIGNGYEWVNGELVEIPETPAEWVNELASRLVDGNLLETVFKDGCTMNEQSLSDIRWWLHHGRF